MFYIEAGDRREGLIDRKPYPEFEAFATLKTSEEFESIPNDRYCIEGNFGAYFPPIPLKREGKRRR
ncbi:MAG: hypothetical protein C4527_08095 [Candidatus Omnitrophota bacterium]|nr:MAG: hypothetical protein C4527_08095 [Candidatus Omnitrophota bacterium]